MLEALVPQPSRSMPRLLHSARLWGLLLSTVVFGLAAAAHGPHLSVPLSSASGGAASASGGAGVTDELLERPDLQAVVNAQVERDGAALVEALGDTDPAVRARAAFALASVQDSAAVPELNRLLRDDPSLVVREQAAFALGQMPGAVPADALLGAIARGRPALQVAALETLGKTGGAEALRRVATASLPDTLEPHRALAIARFGLREVHDSLAVDRLVDMLTSAADDAGRGRRNAAYYFGRVPSTAPWAPHADAVREALDAARPDDPAAMHLVLAVSRLEVAEDDARIVRVLRSAVDARVRVNAARALSNRTERPAVVAALIDALDDSSPHVQGTTAEVLAASVIAPSQSESLIAWVQAHPDRWRVVGPLLRCIAASSDAGVGTPFVRGVVRRYRSDRAAIPYAAVLPALARLKVRTVDPALTAAAEHDDPRVAAAALSALAERWQSIRDTTDTVGPSRTARYFEAFAGGVFRGDVATINAAAPALADSVFADRGAASILVRTLDGLATPDDLEGMNAILRALGTVPTTDAVLAALRTRLQHPHPVIRGAAATALATHTGNLPAVDGGTVDVPPIDWDAARALGPRPHLVLDTEQGRVVIEMDVLQAPQTVTTLARLAREGRYDGVPFHRVVSNFVIQGGDVARGDGWGGPGFTIRSEFTRIPFARGAAGIASAGKDTEGSQYFVTHSMQPHLDGRYTAFGRVVEGMDVVDRILANHRVETASITPTEARGRNDPTGTDP